jgi:hypothetical protein
MKSSTLLGLLAALVGCKTSAPGADVVEASEFRLVRDGRVRASLAVRDGGGPSLSLFDDRGNASLRSELDDKGQPRVFLSSSDPTKPTAVVEVDEKGTHVLFDSPGKEQTYIFQKDDGTSGLVLGNAAGRHRGEMKLSPDGSVGVTLFDGDGGAAFSVTIGRDGSVQRREH